MGASQRMKGKRGEQEAANRLSELLGYIVKRNLGQERDGGADISIGDIAVQVKRQEKSNLLTWMAQAEEDCPDQHLAAVMWRPSRRDWIVAMPLVDWAQLVREANIHNIESVDDVESHVEGLRRRDFDGPPRLDLPVK